MTSLHLRSLRIQVLLWTILPLILVLLILSLTGIGSHRLSVRQLVAEENSSLAGMTATALRTRLDLLDTQFRPLVEGGAPSPASPAASPDSRDGLRLWRFAPDGSALDATPPDWAADIDALDAWAVTADGRLLRVYPTPDGSIVVDAPLAALALGTLVAQPGTGVALLDAQQRIVAAAGQPFQTGMRLDWPFLDAAFGGEVGAVITSSASTTDTPRQPVMGRQVDLNAEDASDSVTAYAPVPETPWVLVLRRPVHDLVAPFFRLEQLLPLILVAVAALSLLTLYFGLSLIVRPLHALVEYAGRIGRGDFRAAAQRVGGLHEIEDLRQALDAMAQQLQSDQLALQDYLRAITSAQEEERARLARDLHDETVQTLIALDHKAQQVQRSLDRHPERTRELLGELRALSSRAAQEVRNLTRALRPPGLDEMGLGPALERLAEEAGADFALVGAPRRAPADLELALYRIAQESLTNSRKHAQATEVRILLRFDPAAITLGIGDDGRGFEPPANLSALTQGGHFGLMGIRERAQLVGASLSIDAAPGCGTRVIVQVGDAGCDLAVAALGALACDAPVNADAILATHAWLGAPAAPSTPEPLADPEASLLLI